MVAGGRINAGTKVEVVGPARAGSGGPVITELASILEVRQVIKVDEAAPHKE